MKAIYPLLLASIVAGGCTTASQHRANVQDDTTDRVSVGTVQREVYIGMTGAEVITAIGSPNIVSTDANRDEVWVYDKLATDVSYSNSESGVLGLIFDPIGSAGAGAVGNKRYSAGASSTSQRTLTVIINFDENKRVKDFAYHTSRF